MARCGPSPAARVVCCDPSAARGGTPPSWRSCAAWGRLGFRDAFRALHGYGEREPTWTWPNGGGYRLDHLVVSSRLDVAACDYRHDWRDEGLSDHSALVAELGAVPV